MFFGPSQTVGTDAPSVWRNGSCGVSPHLFVGIGTAGRFEQRASILLVSKLLRDLVRCNQGDQGEASAGECSGMPAAIQNCGVPRETPPSTSPGTGRRTVVAAWRHRTRAACERRNAQVARRGRVGQTSVPEATQIEGRKT